MSTLRSTHGEGRVQKKNIEPENDTLSTRFHTPDSPGVFLQYLDIFQLSLSWGGSNSVIQQGWGKGREGGP